MDETITISLKEYNELLKDSEFLSYLQGAGVDNWEGYDLAVEMMNEANESDWLFGVVG